MTAYAPVNANKTIEDYFSIKAITVSNNAKEKRELYVLADKKEFPARTFKNNLLESVLSFSTNDIIEKVEGDFKSTIQAQQGELNYLLWIKNYNYPRYQTAIKELLQNKAVTTKGKALFKKAKDLTQGDFEALQKEHEALFEEAQNALAKTYKKMQEALSNEISKSRQELVKNISSVDFGELTQAVKIYIGNYAFCRLVNIWDAISAVVEYDGALKEAIVQNKKLYNGRVLRTELFNGADRPRLSTSEPYGGIKPFMDFIKGQDGSAYNELNEYAKKALSFALKPLNLSAKEAKEIFAIANKENVDGEIPFGDDESHGEKIKSITLVNSPIRKDPNDKIFKNLFTMTDEEAISGYMAIIEEQPRKNKKDIEKIQSYVKLTWENGIEEYLTSKKFDFFEREVTKTAISEHMTHTNGDTLKPFDTTLEALYRAMVGDDGQGETRKIPSPDTLDKIKQAIYKGAHCWLDIDLSEVCKEYGYNEGKPCTLKGYLLPCSFLEGVVVNGKPTTIIHFAEVSPLYRAAEIKNGQILTYEKRLLNVPTISNTVDNIAVKGYLWQRISEITAHNLEPSMLISTILEANNLTDINRKAKSKLIKDIEEMLNYWLKEKIFAGYSLQDRKGEILRGKRYKNINGEIKIIDFPQKAANLGIYKIEILRKKSQEKIAKKRKIKNHKNLYQKEY